MIVVCLCMSVWYFLQSHLLCRQKWSRIAKMSFLGVISALISKTFGCRAPVSRWLSAEIWAIYFLLVLHSNTQRASVKSQPNGLRPEPARLAVEFSLGTLYLDPAGQVQGRGSHADDTGCMRCGQPADFAAAPGARLRIVTASMLNACRISVIIRQGTKKFARKISLF